jgi:hypothetical protein
LYVAGASAAPVTVNFAGGFGFQDFEYLFDPRDPPNISWAFDDAIRATGAVTSAPGQYVFGNWFLSLTFDTDVADVHASPDIGHFPGAVTGRVWLGDTVYAFATDAFAERGHGIGLVPPVALSGPTLKAGGFTFAPVMLYQFQIFRSGADSDALDPSHVANWTAGFIMEFKGSDGRSFSGHELGGGFNVVNVTVPEPSVLPTVTLGLFAAGFVAHARRRATTWKPQWPLTRAHENESGVS